jgi:predicted aconitase
VEHWLDLVTHDYADAILSFDEDTAQIWGRLRVPHSENPFGLTDRRDGLDLRPDRGNPQRRTLRAYRCTNCKPFLLEAIGSYRWDSTSHERFLARS